MKKYLFIVAFMMLVKPIVPVFQYVFDYQYISEVLCVNKEKPELQCNGKCHLMKELAKASEDEKPTSSDKKNHHSEVEILFIEELNTFAIEQNSIVFDNQNTSVYSNLYSHLNCKTFFHPPSFIS
ncbi:hypothetical protein ACFPVY_09350 [Flavobacterium qiangtangense]|uniref:Uncharacterized protein n=1 Tax=Flavobacterium qiangtangense TaxID=1442595 RepID=A0ABW1PMS9_9FLAO